MMIFGGSECDEKIVEELDLELFKSNTKIFPCENSEKEKDRIYYKPFNFKIIYERTSVNPTKEEVISIYSREEVKDFIGLHDDVGESDNHNGNIQYIGETTDVCVLRSQHTGGIY